MSWKDNIRKAKFQGPRQQYSRVRGDADDLKTAIRTIDFTLGKLAKYLEKNDMFMVREMLTMVQAEVDKIDAEVLEQEKYTGKTKYTPTKFGERIDSKERFSGTKFEGPER